MSNEIVDIMGALEKRVVKMIKELGGRAKVGKSYLGEVEVVEAEGDEWLIYVPDEYIDAIDSKRGELEEFVYVRMKRVVDGWTRIEKSWRKDTHGFRGWDAFCQIKLYVVSEDDRSNYH